PRVLTSAIMERMASSMSADTSRFCPSRAANWLSKLLSLLLSRICIMYIVLEAAGIAPVSACVLGMIRRPLGGPGRPKVLELGLDAFDVQPNGRPARKCQRDIAFRRLVWRRRLERYRQKRQSRPLILK